MEEMDDKGIVLNAAFAISAAFVLGDQLAFILAFSKEQNISGKYLLAVVISKMVGGITALVVAQLFYKRLENQEIISEEKKI